MKKIILVFIVPIVFLCFSLTAFANTPAYTCTKISPEERTQDVNQGQRAYFDFVIKNIDPDREITMEITFSQRKDATNQPMPIEWLGYDGPTEIILAPNEEKPISVYVDVPEDAEMDVLYMAKAKCRLLDFEGKTTGGGVTMTTAIGIPVYVKIVDEEIIQEERPVEESVSEEITEKKDINTVADKSNKQKRDWHFSFENYFIVIFVLLIILLIIKIYTLEKRFEEKHLSKKKTTKKKNK